MSDLPSGSTAPHQGLPVLILCAACCAAGLAAAYLTLMAHGALIGRVGVHLDLEGNVTFPEFTHMAAVMALVTLGSIALVGLLGLTGRIRAKPCLGLVLYHLVCACIVQGCVVLTADRIEDRLETRDILLRGADLAEEEVYSSVGQEHAHYSLFRINDTLAVRVHPIPPAEIIPALVDRLRQAGYDAHQRIPVEKRGE